MLGETKNQFSLARVVLSTAGRAQEAISSILVLYRPGAFLALPKVESSAAVASTMPAS